MSDEDPISYQALAKGTSVLTTSGTQFATVEHVLEIPELDLFDGLVVDTTDGVRFVDSEQVERITTAAVHTTLTDADAAQLPAPDAPPVYEADALEDLGNSLSDRFGRLFGRPHWKRDHS